MELNYELFSAIERGDFDLARNLVDQGADVNAEGSSGETILYTVASSGNLELVKWLVEEKEADVKAKGLSGEAILHAAAESGNLELVKWLVEEKEEDVNAKGLLGHTVLQAAAESGNLKLVKWLVKEKEADVKAKGLLGNTVMCAAAFSGNLELVKWLVEEKEMDVNAGDVFGRTVLQAAAESGNLELVKWLVDEKEMDVHAKGWLGNTVMCAAIESGNLELVKWLVEEKEADVNADAGFAQVVLHKAADAKEWKLVEFLIKKEADFEVKDWHSLTILHKAVDAAEWELVKWLVKNGANFQYIKIKNPDMYTAATLADSIAQNIECEFDLPKGQGQLFLNRLKWKLSTSGSVIDNIQDFMGAISNLKLPNDLDKKIKNFIKKEQENLLQAEAELMYKLKQSNTPMPLWMPISDLSDALEGKSLEFYKEHYPDWKDLIAEYESNNISAERKGELVSKIKNSAGAFISSLSENEMRELIKRSDKKEVSKEAKLSAIIERVLSSPILPKAAAKILSSVEYDIEKLLAEGAVEELEMVQSLISKIADAMSDIEGEDILAIYSAIYEDAALEAAWQEPKKITTSNSESLLGKLKGLIELFPTDQAQDLLGRITKSGEKILHDTMCKPDHVGTTEVLGEVVASDSCSSGAPLPAFEGDS